MSIGVVTAVARRRKVEHSREIDRTAKIETCAENQHDDRRALGSSAAAFCTTMSVVLCYVGKDVITAAYVSSRVTLFKNIFTHFRNFV